MRVCSVCGWVGGWVGGGLVNVQYVCSGVEDYESCMCMQPASQPASQLISR